MWKHTVDEYISFLVEHDFNAVRLPLSAAIVAAPSWQIDGGFICGGAYEGWESLDILDDVVNKLQVAGVFVALDVHTLTHPEHNDPCGASVMVAAMPRQRNSSSLRGKSWPIDTAAILT